MLTLTLLLLAAFVVATLAWTVAAVRYALRFRPRRGEFVGQGDRALLAACGVLAGLAWWVLLPLHLAGWVGRRLAGTSRRTPAGEGARATPPPAPATVRYGHAGSANSPIALWHPAAAPARRVPGGLA